MSPLSNHIFLKKSLLLLCLMLGMMIPSAQITSNSIDYQTTIRTFTTKDGLSHNTVYGVYQDSHNLYWIPARYDLNRFDGQEFKLYTKGKNGLHSNILDIVYEDKNPESTTTETGMIWLLTGLGNSDVWFIENNAFRYSIFNPYTEQVIDAKGYLGTELYEHLQNMVAYERQADHLLFFISTGQVIKYFHRDKVEIIQLPKPLEQLFYYKKLSNQQYWTGFIEGTHKNFQLFSQNHQVIKKQQICLEKHVCENPLADIGHIYPIPTNSKSDSLWLSSNEGTSSMNAIFCMTPEEGIIPIPYHTLLPNLPKQQALGTLFYDETERLFWLTDRMAKTYIVHLEKGLVFTFDFPIEYVWLKDLQGLFWASSQGKLYAIQFNKMRFQKHLQGASVRGIVVDNQKRIWAYPNHIEGLNSSPDSFRFNYALSLAYQGLMKDMEETIWSFCIQNNQIWLGQFLKENGGKGILSPTGLPATSIWSIYQDKTTGRFWGGGENGLLFNYVPETQTTTVFQEWNGFEEFKASTIYQIKPFGEQHFWLAASSGLYLMHQTKGLLAKYGSESEAPHYLPAEAIHHIHIDRENNFWLGSRDEGLFQMSVTKLENSEEGYQLKMLQQFTVADGLPSNSIHAIYENNDADGYLWLSTENGITQFHKTTHFSTNFSTEDGVVHPEGNRIAHYQDEEGRLYFGTIAGITSFHPKDFSLLPDTLQKYIHLVGFEQYSTSKHQMENRITLFQEGEKIVLPAKEGRVELTLSQPFSLSVQNVFYTYQIQGLHPEPISLLQPKITISDVPFGKYTLALRAFNSKGDLLDSKDIPLLSERPFYLQWWFLGSLLLLGGILAYLVILYRTKKLLRQKALLEAEVQQRTRQLEADKIIIEKQAKKLMELDETKSRFFANVSHELRTPIQLIQSPIRSVLKMNILNNKGFTLLLKAEQSTKNLLRLVNEILDLTKWEADKLSLNEEKIILFNFMRRIISHFQSVADAKSIQFHFIFHLKKTLQIQLDKDKAEKILNNLLSNAFKFTPKGGRVEVEISETIEQTEGHFLIKIKDNGRGIPQADLPHIFNRFYQSSANQKAEGGLGIGLALSMEFVQLMKGKMWVESNPIPPYQGSTFFVQFPKKEVITMLSEQVAVGSQQWAVGSGQSEVGSDKAVPPIQEAKLDTTILLIEDNHDLSAYIQFLLAPHYHVITAENGQEAIGRLTADGQRWTVDDERQIADDKKYGTKVQETTKETREAFLNTMSARRPPSTVHRLPSLIISDIMMPIMDGFEFLEKVKAHEQWRHIPFIMLTARAGLKDKLRALRIGVDDYLLKPFQEEELLARIENLLTNAEERKAYIQSQPTLAKDQQPEAVIGLSDTENRWLEKVEHLVLQHLKDHRFSINFLAELLDINRKTLYKRIKMLTGLTPHQYTRAIRLQYAKEQLELGRYTSVKAAANDVGFVRPDYFSKLFVKAFGKSPSEYFE